MAVGAGVALTGGVKRLPPVGLMLFSVGDGALVVVGVVVLEGLWEPLPLQAVSAPIEMAAAMPIPAATRRVIGAFFTGQSLGAKAKERDELNHIVQFCVGQEPSDGYSDG
jgi:hypothetical protein